MYIALYVLYEELFLLQKNFVSTCNQATIVVLLLTSRNGNYSTVTAKEATELK